MKLPCRVPHEIKRNALSLGAGIIQPSIADCIQLLFYCLPMRVLLFFVFFPPFCCILLVGATPALPYTVTVSQVFTHISYTDVYWGFTALLMLKSVQRYLQHCNIHIKPVVAYVYLCVYGSKMAGSLLCETVVPLPYPSAMSVQLKAMLAIRK